MDGSHELQEDTPLLVRPPYELRAGVGELFSSGSDDEEDEEEGGRWNGSHREERQSASQISSAARGALGFWLWLHGGAVYASLAYEDSWLARQRQAGQVGWVLVYGALLLGTVVLFAQVHSSDPGYLCKSSAAGTGSYSGASERGAIGSGVAVRPSMTNASDALSDNVGGSSRSRGHLVASSSSSDEDAGLGVGAETVELLPRTGARKDAGCGAGGGDGWATGDGDAWPPRRTCELCGHITQPLRAKHCHDCGRCVSRYDHHCFWINTCVGERNHAAFLKFLALQSVFGGWSLVVLFGAFPKQGDTSASAYFSAHLLLSSVFLVTLLGLWFPLGLTVYHCYLALTAQTTWEHLRAANIYYLGEAGYPPDYHPWDVGLWSNFHNFCCTMVREDGQPTVWRLGVRPKHAVPRQNIFDNEYYSCC